MAHTPSPPGEAAMYSVSEIAGIIAFLDNVTIAFESDPGTRDEFFALVTAFGSGHGGGAAAVVARATEILGARPVLLAQFRACLSRTQDGALAASRPRRRSPSRPVAALVPADDDPDEVDAAAAAFADVDDKNEKRLRRKRERERARRAEKKELAEAIGFLNRVKHVAGDEVHWRFLNVLFDAQADPTMDANAIYDDVRESFGPAHRRLLHRFATTFLPGEAEWLEHQARRKERKRRRNAAGGDHAQSMNSAKKLRTDDGDHGPREPVRVQDTASRRSTIAGDNGGTTSAAVVAPVAVDRFRALWEFATGYSVLLATMARTKELIELHPLPDDEDEGGGGAYSLDLENLFPSRDSRTFLERMYGARWRKMRMGLEDAGLAGRALRVVMDSLRWAEARAVEDAREHRDKARAAEELNDMLTKMVNDEERRST